MHQRSSVARHGGAQGHELELQRRRGTSSIVSYPPTRRRIESPKITDQQHLRQHARAAVDVGILARCSSKNDRSLARAVAMSTLALMSNCDRLTTAHHRAAAARLDGEHLRSVDCRADP